MSKLVDTRRSASGTPRRRHRTDRAGIRPAAALCLLALPLLFSAPHPFGSRGVPVALAQAAPETGQTTPAATGSADDSGVVIPPGQEELLTEMLGKGATLPGSCKFAGGSVEGSIVQSTYACPAGEVVFELHHPSRAPAGATRTTQFALTLKSGSPPDGLQAALVALIRAREGSFRWKWLNASPWQSSRLVIPLAAAGFLALVVLGLVLRRRGRAKKG